MRKLNKSELKRVYGGLHPQGRGLDNGNGTSDNPHTGGSDTVGTDVD